MGDNEQLRFPPESLRIASVRWVRFFFGLEGRVSRPSFALAGLLLGALKFSVEAAWAWRLYGASLSPVTYLDPRIQVRYQGAFGEGDWLWLLAWTLPFLWTGFALTLRRAEDAGLSPVSSLLFFVPILNLALFAGLCLAPSSHTHGRTFGRGAFERRTLRGAGLGAFAATAIGIGMAASISVIGQYGLALFIGAPFVMGLVSAYLTNDGQERTMGSTLAVSTLSVVLTAGALFAFAAEGLVCLVMAAPIGFVLSSLGALMGRSLARSRLVPQRVIGVLALPLPLFAGIDPPSTDFHDVESEIEVAASPDRVWPLVAAFPEIRSEPELLFRIGIAMPRFATIEGEGVGATRRCVFTTGEFVEPITVWDPPSRLAFSVTRQPRALSELTPYEALWAPHLDGHVLRVAEGEFRLIPLPDGGTRIVGRTRYALDMSPKAYWRAWGDGIIHRIHMRVLTHIKDMAEGRVGG